MSTWVFFVFSFIARYAIGCTYNIPKLKSHSLSDANQTCTSVLLRTKSLLFVGTMVVFLSELPSGRYMFDDAIKYNIR